MKLVMTHDIVRQFKLIVLASTVSALICGGIGCGGEAKPIEPVVSVQTKPAERAAISQVVSAEAVVFPLQQATLAPKISSTITEFKVQRGSRVKKGQLLAVLENKDLAATEQATRGDLQQAEANYVTTVDATLPQQLQKAELDGAAAQTAFDAQRKIYQSRKELFQQGAIPRRDLDAAEVALAQARSQWEQAQRQLADLKRMGKEQILRAAEGTKESAEGKHRAAAAQLSYSLIRSPMDGVVTDRPLFVGDLAAANQPILTVMDISRLIAKAHIPQSDAATLKVGNPADLKIRGVDDPINGRVSLVSPALDPGSTTIEVWVEARKPDPALKPGMTVEVSIVAKTVKDAIVVPSAAIFKDAEGADYVLVAGSDEKAHQKKVQVGIRNQGAAQLVSGINSGEPVIIAGGYAVPDNTKIKIEAPAGAEKQAADNPADSKDQTGSKKDQKKQAKAGGSADKGKD
jgi:multidrug efflux pump subunit AcrA (membrane-fusion protein)